ncbi:hypothetical protein KCP73_03120 [Salmonella enterica subsp. enterica]|nr:hypothetical protein KCP73_03120 [Salmonella enterica subsp. enterica]
MIYGTAWCELSYRRDFRAYANTGKIFDNLMPLAAFCTSFSLSGVRRNAAPGII